MNKTKKALVLGGTNAHSHLIKCLIDEGYYTILVDYLEKPPAAEFADEHVRISTLDEARIEEIAINSNARLVLSTSVDQANLVSCRVSEKLGLPTFYKSSVASFISDKEKMKDKMRSNDLPTANFKVVRDASITNCNDLNFPIVIKPVDTNGSKGVVKVANISELSSAVEFSLSCSREKKVVIEEFIDGREFSFDYVVLMGRCYRLLVREKFNIKEIKSQNFFQCFSSVAPAFLPEEELRKMDVIAEKLVKTFSLEKTPVIIQAIYDDKKSFKIIEFAARIGGGLSARAIKYICQIDLVGLTVKMLDGEMTELVLPPCKEEYVIAHNFYARRGILSHVEGLDECLAGNLIKEFYIHKSAGDQLKEGFESRDRVFSVLIVGETLADLEIKVLEVFKAVRVIDLYNNDLLIRDHIWENPYV
jgi:phosphoribosylamine-glycine ligase